MRRLQSRLAALAFVAALLVCVPPCISQPVDEAERVLKEAVKILHFGNRMHWSILDPPLDWNSDGDPIALETAVSRPLGRESQISGWTLPEVIDFILKHREVPRSSLSISQAKGQEYYRRILDARYPVISRWLGLSPEYSLSPDPNSHYLIYEHYRRNFSAAQARLRNLRPRQRGFADAERILEAAWTDWNVRGNRVIYDLILDNYQLYQELDPVLTWEDLDKTFALNGGVLWRDRGSPMKTSFIPSITEMDNGETVWRSLGPISQERILSYSIVRIDRPWVNPLMLYFYEWKWSSNSPLGATFWFSEDTATCNKGAFPCLSEFAVVVKSTTSVGTRTQVIGLIGEPLVRPAWGGVEDEKSDQVRRVFNVNDVISRLRNGTF